MNRQMDIMQSQMLQNIHIMKNSKPGHRNLRMLDSFQKILHHTSHQKEIQSSILMMVLNQQQFINGLGMHSREDIQLVLSH